jgi:hypothetical protein
MEMAAARRPSPTSIEAVVDWLRNGNAYMEHPDGQAGTDEAADAVRTLAAERDRLQAEVARLREALEEIEQSGRQHGAPPLEEYTDGDGHSRCIWVARRALADREPAP